MPDGAAIDVSIKPKAKKKTRLWWSVHQWVGLKLSLLMGFILLTGTIAVFSYEIDWLLDPSIRVKPATVEGDVAWGTIAENAVEAVPGAEVQFLGAPVDRGFAARVLVVNGDGKLKWVYAHPTTGEIQGVSTFANVQRIFRSLHRHLMLPNKYGIPIVTSLSILLLISLVTSFVVYKKWWRGFFKPVRFRDARTTYGDLHRLAGVWSLWFVALMAITGLWYLVESLGGRAPRVAEPEVPAVEFTVMQNAAGLDAAIAAATQAKPELDIRFISLPSEQLGAYGIFGQEGAVLVRDNVSGVYVAPGDQSVLMTTEVRDLNVHQRISEASDPLHFGTFGGVWTKLIWFIFGAALTFLTFSGTAIYAVRLKRSGKEVEPNARALVVAMKGMGRWKYPAIFLILVSLVLIVVTICVLT